MFLDSFLRRMLALMIAVCVCTCVSILASILGYNTLWSGDIIGRVFVLVLSSGMLWFLIVMRRWYLRQDFFNDRLPPM